MPEHVDKIDITVFDTETTGLKPDEGDRIVELAALRFKANQPAGVFNELVNCGRQVSPAAFAVNKISAEMLKNAPQIGSVMPKFLDFIQGSYLCSYNAAFDINFLNQELKLLGKPAVNNFFVFDVLAIARKLMPGLPRYALWFVAEKLEIKSPQEHRALADVQMSWDVFCRLKDICSQKGQDLGNFCELFAFKI